MAFLDSIYGAATRLMPAPGKFFHKGYGNMELAESIRQEVVKQMMSPHPMEAANLSWGDSHEKKARICLPGAPQSSWGSSLAGGGSWWWPGWKEGSHKEVCMVIRSATFDSPAAQWLPAASKQAHMRFVHQKEEASPRRIVIHLPTTGDQFYWMRTRVAETLLSDGVASIIPMFPYYGPRRPQDQTAHFFRTVADFVTAASAALLEAGAIASWARREYPQAELCFTGVSMGGTLASAAAILAAPRQGDQLPGLAVVPAVGTWSAETFIRGVLRKRIDWTALSPRHDGEAASPDAASQAEDKAVDSLAGVLRRFSLRAMLGEKGAGPRPPRLDAVVQVSAKGDAFIPKDDAEKLYATLAGLAAGHECANLVWDDGGHLSLSCDAFRFTSAGVYTGAIQSAFGLLETRRGSSGMAISNGPAANGAQARLGSGSDNLGQHDRSNRI